MNIKFFSTILFLVAIFQPTYGQQDLYSDPSLVLYLPFDGNANDFCGNNNNGYVNNAILTSDRNGKEYSAYYFDGKSSYIEIPESQELNSTTSSLTISTWICVKDWCRNVWAPLMSKSNTSAFGMYGFQFLNLSTSRKFPDYIKQFEVYFNDDHYVDSQMPISYLSAKYAFELNTWYFVAFTWDGINCSYYINGVQIDKRSYNGKIKSDHNPLIIGKDAPSALEFLKGKLDEIRIYKRGLSEKEINELYR